MGKMIGIAFAFAIIIVAILMFPDMTDSIESASVESFEETFVVATAAGATTGICNLTMPLFNDDITEVMTISSDLTTDHPSAYSYDATEDDLTIRSLVAETSRNITVTYNTEDTNNFTGLNKIFDITPMLILLAILAIAGIAIWAGFFRGRN